MSTIAEISSTLYTESSSSSYSTEETSLDQQDFLELLCVQLQNQDPSDPLDPSEMASQLTEYSSLEKMDTMNDNLDTILEQIQLMNSNSSYSNCLSALGTEATYTSDDDTEITGTVTGVTMDDDATYMIIDGDAYIDIESVSAFNMISE